MSEFSNSGWWSLLFGIVIALLPVLLILKLKERYRKNYPEMYETADKMVSTMKRLNPLGVGSPKWMVIAMVAQPLLIPSVAVYLTLYAVFGEVPMVMRSGMGLFVGDFIAIYIAFRFVTEFQKQIDSTHAIDTKKRLDS